MAQSRSAAARKESVEPRSGQDERPSGADAGNVPAFSKDEELKAYRDMLLIRRFEEKAGQLYGMGLIGGFCHLYIGQEAVVVGLQMAMKEGDQVITGYRDHGHMLATGMDPKGVMAELTGRRSGYSRGKGGSMHMFSKEKNFYGGHGIVGAQVPLGTGLAFANKYRENGNVSLTYFGDGAVEPGPGLRELQHGEALVAAGRLRHREQPVCDGHQRQALVGDDGSLQARSLLRHSGRAGRRHGRARREGRRRQGARACALRQGADILEMLTYRYRGHSMSDPAKYRTKEEVQKMRTEHDPIEQVKRRLLEKGWASEDELKEIDKEIRQHRQRGGRIRPAGSGAGSRPSCGPTSSKPDRHRARATGQSRRCRPRS